ncbi:hypothetical protein INS49_002609 [Diaporthe citri]|uniref:uncharacterized protein n=1 Tax=Diaporthe citri TaxID=83186 RepID=UPI001C7EFE31|nr:uncharacterized protein INS49_002609 [Diaporthe citri]KAG6368403.1 hypothetical protein INS49_002609 [Diaporthe citri]
MDEVGAALPTDEHTTESAIVAGVSTFPSPGQLTPEHVCMEDISIQLINVESIQQTIRTHGLNLEKSNETTVFELKPRLPIPEDLQSSLRETLAAHARPSIPKLHILQLPDELLMEISENARGVFDFEDDNYSIAGIKDIKSLRLTFKHLDRVSRHPTISKGIRSLQIFVGLYRPIPESNLQNFITEVLRIMREDHQGDLSYLQHYAQEFEPEPDFEASNRPSPQDHEYLYENVDDLGKREKLIRLYINFLRNETSESDEDQNIAILRQAYKYHKLRLSEKRVKDLSGGQARVSKLVSLFLNGTNLRSVTLSFNCWQSSQTDERSSLEPLLALLPWVNLKRISLANGYFQYDELSKHLEKLKPGTYIDMDGVHLLSGLWADLLDVLRLKADCDSTVRDSTGNDDEELDYTYRGNFITWDDTPNLATAYIRGDVFQNPLRSPPAQDNTDQDDVDQDHMGAEN